jgi:hypothetical protein
MRNAMTDIQEPHAGKIMGEAGIAEYIAMHESRRPKPWSKEMKAKMAAACAKCAKKRYMKDAIQEIAGERWMA